MNAKLFAGIATVMILSTGAVNAAEGFSAGIGGGRAHMKDACSGLTGISSCDDTDTSFKIFGGYQFDDNWGLELGYVDFGKATASGAGASGEAKVNGLTLAGVGTLPINDLFSVFGKLGFVRYDLKVSGSSPGVTFSAEDKNSALMYGVGAQYNVTEQVGIRAEWELFKKVGDSGTTGESDIDQLSASLVYKF